MHRFFKLSALLALVVLVVGGIPAATISAVMPPAGTAGPSTTSLTRSPAITAGILLRLANYAFDPLEGNPAHLAPAGLALQESSAEQASTYFVQFKGPIQQQWKEAVVAAGGQILDYIPDFAFVVAMDRAARHAVEAMNMVRWVGDYHPIYRLERSLLDTALSTPENQRVPVIIVVFKTGDVGMLIQQVQSMGGQILDTLQTHWRAKIHAHIPAKALGRIAALNGVKWIEPAPKWQLSNSEADNLLGVRDVWDTRGLYGAGQVVAVCDTGLDQGSTSPANLHDDFENGSGGSRVIKIYDRVGDGANDVNSGHGTHVAGSVLGNGIRSGSTPASHIYPDTAHVGIAPEANLVFQAVESNATGYLTGIPIDLNKLFIQVITDGATIHANSWGAALNGEYSSYSEDVDQFIWEHPDFTILFSAGNAGTDSLPRDGIVDLDSMDTPATAKNCITVGASENDRASGGYNPGGACWKWGGIGGCWPSDYDTLPIRDDRLSDNPGGVAAFSARGPTDDGRYKPDLVAPGTNIVSTKSSAASETGWGPLDAYYMYMGGTSMATPLAAGAAALVREYYINSGITPSAALIKATLINGATDLYPGQYGAGSTIEIPSTRPTHVAGWGRIDVENALFPPSPQSRFGEDDTVGLHTGDVFSAMYTITDPSSPFRVTLAWSDYPGSPITGGRLVNDLDLAVTGPDGTVYYPNNANPLGHSTHFDRANNIVGIDIGTPLIGVYTVTVHGYNVPEGPQPFALVVSGGITWRPQPVVSSIQPNTGVNTGIVQITELEGGAFEQGAIVKLTRSNHLDILAGSVTVVNSNTITCTFDLRNVATGPWNVTVVNPDTTSGTLVDGFTVTAPSSAPTVTGISPSQAPANSIITVTALKGSHFLPGAAVKLTQSGQSDVAGSNVTVIDTDTITCTLDLRGAAAGYWNVVVANPDKRVGILSNGFYVTAPPSRFAYMPLFVYKYHSPGINNGDLELGAVYWTEYSSNGYALIMHESSLPALVSAHSGEWAVWLGGVDDEVSYIEQQVRVPYDSPYLSYWHWIASEEAAGLGLDMALVLINDTAIVQYELSEDTSTGGWFKNVVDLRAFGGQAISLQIRTVTNGTLNSNLFVDDISFQASATSQQDTTAWSDLSGLEHKLEQIHK